GCGLDRAGHACAGHKLRAWGLWVWFGRCFRRS
ncbi:hypothetical protein HaLaN_32482, partial [Haematococcus lacustris]